MNLNGVWKEPITIKPSRYFKSDKEFPELGEEGVFYTVKRGLREHDTYIWSDEQGRYLRIVNKRICPCCGR